MEASRTPPAGSTGAAPTLALPLKPYDVRQERDLARRRQLSEATRRVLRVTTLGVADLTALGAALAVAILLLGQPLALWRLAAPPVLSVLLLSLLVVNAYGPGTFRTDTGARARGLLLGLAVLALQALLSLPALAPSPGTVPVGLGTLPVGLGTLALFGVLALPALEAERTLVDRAVRGARAKGHLVRAALVVGDEEEALALSRQLLDHPHSDLRVVGRLAPGDALEDAVHTHDARVVVLAAGLPAELAAALVTRAFDAGASVLPMPSPAQRAAAATAALPAFDPTTLEVSAPRLRLPELGIKRGLDLLLTVPALVLLSPLFALAAAAVRLDSPGPILFRQTRLGVGGRPFTLLKFRTMVADAEQRLDEVAHLNQYGDGRLFKAKHDPRVTRVGRVLRRTSIDELPQLINVLLGDMSLVGPRPPIPREVAAYHEDHLVRLTVVPGLTGPWQAGGRNEVDSFEEVVRLERDYIAHWSLWLDLRILARTVAAVVRGEGAA